MQLVIDQRENAIKEIIPKLNLEKISVNYEQLSIGDILIKKDDKILYIFERKTCDDLLSSITDGRYREQKYRLLEHFNCANVVYIIEGKNPNSCQKSKLVCNTIINTLFRDNIKVIRSDNVGHTVDIIVDITKKCEKGTFETKQTQEYSEMIKAVKKVGMTSEVWYISCLKNIPGISEKIAQEIIKNYPTFRELFLAFETNGEFILQNIKVGSRCIGKKTSEKVCNFLLN